MNIIDLFDHGANYNSNGVCMRHGDWALSYGECQDYSHRIGLALHAQDVGDDCKVGIYTPNHMMGLLAMLGVFRAGACLVTINAKNALDENLFIMQNADLEWLFYHSAFEPVVEEIRSQVPSLRGLVCIDKPGDNAPSLEAWCANFEGRAPALDDKPDRLSLLQSTGGTTGRPKASCLTDRSMEAMISNFMISMPCEQPPVHLMVAPMTHACMATGFLTLAQGGTNVFMDEVDVKVIMQMIERHKVTHLFLPPTVIYVMLAHPDVREYDYSSLKYFLYLAAPMSADKLRQAIDVFGPVMVQSFGQAEAPMILTYMSVQDHLDALQPGNERRLLSCGRETPLTRVAIMDEEGNVLDCNQRGEIVIRGPLVMAGYYKNTEATAEASLFGWHHTGDIGYIDDEGFVFIVDRKKEMIISGGFNVFPSEIEQVIWSHPAVQDCAVIGVPDDKWGEAVKAVIEPVPGMTIDAGEIMALCKEKLGSVKTPKSVDVCDSLPRSPVGKVLKKEIRKPYWVGHERAI